MRRTDQRRAAVVALYQHDVTGRPLDDVLEPTATPFTRSLVEDVVARRDEIDAVIGERSQGWTLERIAPLERNILRVGLCELLFREDDVPAEVALDEAVEAAKELCGSDAPGFVNGILGAVHRDRMASR